MNQYARSAHFHEYMRKEQFDNQVTTIFSQRLLIALTCLLGFDLMVKTISKTQHVN